MKYACSNKSLLRIALNKCTNNLLLTCSDKLRVIQSILSLNALVYLLNSMWSNGLWTMCYVSDECECCADWSCVHECMSDARKCDVHEGKNKILYHIAYLFSTMWWIAYLLTYLLICIATWWFRFLCVYLWLRLCGLLWNVMYQVIDMLKSNVVCEQ